MPVTRATLDSNSFFERMADHFVDDKDTAAAVAAGVSQDGLSQEEQDKARQVKERIEAIKKDGGDQWLLIFNNYMEGNAGKAQKTNARSPVDELSRSLPSPALTMSTAQTNIKSTVKQVATDKKLEATKLPSPLVTAEQSPAREQ